MAIKFMKKSKYSSSMRFNSKFRPEFYLTTYLHAKNGLGKKKIAAMLGVDYQTFIRWISLDPALREAYKAGNETSSNKLSITSYIENHLPEELMPIWRKIFAYNHQPHGVRKIEALLLKRGKRTRQRLFIHALTTCCNYNHSKACRMVGINPRILAKWSQEPEFKDLLEMVDKILDDYWEEKLYLLGEQSNPYIIMNVNKARNKRYKERSTVALEGHVTHSHGVKPLSALGLPANTLQTILGALQAKEAVNTPALPQANPLNPGVPIEDFTASGQFDMSEFENIEEVAPEEVKVEDVK